MNIRVPVDKSTIDHIGARTAKLNTGAQWCSPVVSVGIRVRSDKYRTGIIKIVPVRTASVKIEKYQILRRPVIFQISILCNITL